MAAVPVAPPPSAPEAAPLSQGARIINTFIAPSKTFTDIRRSASWWAPYLLVAICTLLFMAVIDRQVGFDQVTKNEMARSPKRAEQFEKLTPAQQEQQMKIAVTITRVFSYAVPVLILLFYVIFAAIYMGIFNMAFGAQIPFKRYYAIVVYAGLPGIINAALACITLFAGVDPEGFNINNPVATNLAHFMDPNGNKFVYGMASAVDVFIWWGIVLTGIGISCNSKVKRSTAIITIGALYIAYRLVASGIAAAIS